MNYKIRITDDNLEAIKKIANDNGMNKVNLQFDLRAFFWKYYYIQNGHFTHTLDDHSNYNELTTEQFIEMFDKKKSASDYKSSEEIMETEQKEKQPRQPESKEELINYLKPMKLGTVNELIILIKRLSESLLSQLHGVSIEEKAGLLYHEVYGKSETELDKWLRETKAKNLSRVDLLNDFICSKFSKETTEYWELRKKLNLKVGESLSEALYNQWQKEKDVDLQRKIIGYKAPFDIVEWEIEKGDVLVFNEERKSYNIPNSIHDLPKEIVETWEAVYEEVEQPKEKTFKEKVIKVIETEIADGAYRLNELLTKIKEIE